MTLKKYEIPKYVYVLWFSLVVAIGVGIFRTEWETVFVSVLTLGLTLYSVHVFNRLKYTMPPSLLTITILFVYATLFLGEVGNFYERFWWWDLLLHGGSAIGIGLVGIILLMLMLGTNLVAASPRLIGLFAFVFSVAIGAIWEIFEFTMDITFGLSMQKSGLVDTMTDLIINSLGALLASVVGYFYLKNSRQQVLSSVIEMEEEVPQQ
jgi:hypothetical protein